MPPRKKPTVASGSPAIPRKAPGSAKGKSKGQAAHPQGPKNGGVGSSSGATAGVLVAVNQTAPILRLPAEMLSEIISHFPCPYPWAADRELPTEITHETLVGLKAKLYTSYLAWRRDVVAFSRVCRMFRELVLPKLWERLVIGTDVSIGAWYKDVADRTEGASDTLMSFPNLQPHLKSAILTVTRCRANEVLPKLATALATLPSLEVISISHIHPRVVMPFRNAFEGVQLTAVRRLLISPAAHYLIAACPNVRDVQCVHSDTSAPDGTVIIAHLGKTKIEVLGGNTIGWNDVKLLKRLLKAAPGLKDFEYYGDVITKDAADILAKFKHLRILRIREWGSRPGSMASVSVLKAASLPALEEFILVSKSGELERI